MQISRSEFAQFCAIFSQRHKEGGEWQFLRFGQAWFNYFNLHRCHFNDEEGALIDTIYNTEDTFTAKVLIVAHFVMNEH